MLPTINYSDKKRDTEVGELVSILLNEGVRDISFKRVIGKEDYDTDVNIPLGDGISCLYTLEQLKDKGYLEEFRNKLKR